MSVVEATSGDDARDQTDDGRIDRVFELNMGIFRLKFAMNFLMNLSTQLQIIAALLVGGWLVYRDKLEIGGVVAFISGVGRFTDPWGDLTFGMSTSRRSNSAWSHNTSQFRFQYAV